MVAVEPVLGGAVSVREFDGDRDRAAVERLETACEVGPSGGGGGKMCLFTDLLGDPLCRVRNSPAYLMLVRRRLVAYSPPRHYIAHRHSSRTVALLVPLLIKRCDDEWQVAETTTTDALGDEENEIVGVVRGCVKTVSCGGGHEMLVFCKAAYLLGLRVSPAHRRRGVGRRLVARMEEWFRGAGAEYAYVATDADNEACARLFTSRCGYSEFRRPAVLVHPVFRHHDLAPSRRARIVRLSPREAEALYRRRFAAVEFSPRDIDAVLANPLSLGTFLAAPPASWAVASVWSCKDAFRLELRGAPRLWRAARDPVRSGVPHWPRLGAEDLW
jgi:GNAT superfamily N-acetyltransferase